MTAPTIKTEHGIRKITIRCDTEHGIRKITIRCDEQPDDTLAVDLIDDGSARFTARDGSTEKHTQVVVSRADVIELCRTLGEIYNFGVY